MTTAALAPTALIDADHPDVVAFARNAAGDRSDPADAARALFAAVRDEVRYDPWQLDLTVEGMRASAALDRRRGWCVTKATLLAAACRALEVPARVGYADVRNHLSSQKLSAAMGTDVFRWHGYTVIELDGRAHKASPAFNRELCERVGVEPLDFDGRADALLHALDGQGRQYMEYINDLGVFDDVPLDRIQRDLQATYPQMMRGRDDEEVDPVFG